MSHSLYILWTNLRRWLVWNYSYNTSWYTYIYIYIHIMLELFWMAQVRENWTSPPKIGWMHPNKEGYPMQSMPEISDKLQKECYSRNYIAQGEWESRVDLTWVYIYLCTVYVYTRYISATCCVGSMWVSLQELGPFSTTGWSSVLGRCSNDPKTRYVLW